MTRSMRTAPFVPVTNRESDKSDKKQAHQRERKWLHDHLNPKTATAEDFEIPEFHLHPHGGHDLFAKGGKQWKSGEVTALRK